MGEVRAMVREANGQLVLDDPDALAAAKAVAKHNCRQTLAGQSDRVAHFKRRAIDKGVDNVIVVLLNVDDTIGGALTNSLMPGQEAMWQSLRDSGQVPFARGLAPRVAIQEIVDTIDPETGEKIRAMAGRVAILVSDHGVLEAFEAP